MNTTDQTTVATLAIIDLNRVLQSGGPVTIQQVEQTRALIAALPIDRARKEFVNDAIVALDALLDEGRAQIAARKEVAA